MHKARDLVRILKKTAKPWPKHAYAMTSNPFNLVIGVASRPFDPFNLSKGVAPRPSTPLNLVNGVASRPSNPFNLSEVYDGDFKPFQPVGGVASRPIFVAR